MHPQPAQKYRAFEGVGLPDRAWPNRRISAPPIWMSTDLRDGNQALMEPMSVSTKLKFFKALVAAGFKEIEIGFPSASATDFEFARLLIEQQHIPEDVTIEVLVQARHDLITRTVDSVRGAKKVILHIYNPLAPSFRKIVYNLDRNGIKQLAIQGAQWVKECITAAPEVDWYFQYSPECFSSTEIDFSLEVCEAVIAIWQPTPAHKMILNLPATVEMSTPNTYADQIEWMHRHLSHRDAIILSVHPHNDRGTAVAAAELALMAGADRVEGCLFGNGERTGNVDIITLALNLYSQGISPGLDFSHIDQIRKLVEDCTQLPVHPRHPYAGEFVFTAFSGSHQDAIKKGLSAQQKGAFWEVPYLPIDPADLNRSYDAVVRVNSQSGKGGVSFLLQQAAHYQLPRALQIEFSHIVQQYSDATGKEVTRQNIVSLFRNHYMPAQASLQFVEYHQEDQSEGVELSLILTHHQFTLCLKGQGQGPIEAATQALTNWLEYPINIINYHEHALTEGAQGEAVAYMELKINDSSNIFGVAEDKHIVKAAIKALISAINRHWQLIDERN